MVYSPAMVGPSPAGKGWRNGSGRDRLDTIQFEQWLLNQAGQEEGQ